ncbi:MAG: beta-ketoacyl-ACP synthase II [Gemmatimonadota bacterium]|nr:MAG: beta-ketoacyl-ACP synthase II [Gemmatimonadota bacterium]
MENRVVVTGLGVVTPVGNTVDDFWKSLQQGRGGIGRISRFDASDIANQIAAEVKGFDPSQSIGPKELRRMDLYTQYAVVSTQEAVADANLDMQQEDPNRIGVVVGSGIGGIGTWERQHKILLEKGPSRMSPLLVPMMISDIAAGHISMIFGMKGPNYATVSACATSAHAITDACRILQRGDADVMIAGGSEAPVTPLAVGGFASMKATSTRNDEPEKASRPFDAQRDGFILGEGAGVVVLETLDHAKTRGAPIYCELVGCGMTADAYHLTAPAPGGEGAVRSMNIALQDGGLEPRDIDYINAHGTSTPLNDKFETMAIKTVFGDHAHALKISSNKSMVGHLLGAAGVVECIATILTIKHSFIPPTINYEHPDPECDLDYTPNEGVEYTVRAALSNSFGFGGHNVTLALQSFAE